MNKQEKTKIIDVLHQGFSTSQASFLINFKGITVRQMQGLRKVLRENGGNLKIAKARLMKRATAGIDGIQALHPLLKEQIGLVFTKDNSPAVAKALYNYSQQHASLGLVACFFEQRVLARDLVIRIAQLPSKPVLLAQVCSSLNAPARNCVGLLNMLIMRLLFLLKQIAQSRNA